MCDLVDWFYGLMRKDADWGYVRYDMKYDKIFFPLKVMAIGLISPAYPLGGLHWESIEKVILIFVFFFAYYDSHHTYISGCITSCRPIQTSPAQLHSTIKCYFFLSLPWYPSLKMNENMTQNSPRRSLTSLAIYGQPPHYTTTLP